MYTLIGRWCLTTSGAKAAVYMVVGGFVLSSDTACWDASRAYVCHRQTEQLCSESYVSPC